MEENMVSNEILENMANIQQIANLVDYPKLKEVIFSIVKSPQIVEAINRDFFNQVAILLNQDDLFEIFYMNRELKPLLKPYIIEMLENKQFNLTTDQILSILFSYPDTDQEIEKYFPLFLENTDNLISLKEQIEIYDPLLAVTNDYMNQHTEKTIQDLIKKTLAYFKITDVSDTLAVKKLEAIFKEVLTLEHMSISDDIHPLFGSTTCVYQIGTKVVKLSVNKSAFPSISHPRILQPISTKEIPLTAKEQQNIVTTEITHFVDTNHITDDDAYLVFKELKEQGIIWTDPNPDNIGRLYSKQDKDQLNEGYLVIIDAEFIYLKDYPDIKLGNSCYFDKFEDRYRQEQQNKHRK